MHSTLTRVIQRLRNIGPSEGGYVMVTVMGVLLVATLFSVAALAAAQNDTTQSRGDVDRKAAFSAAEAGLNYYLYHLNEDSNFWASCTAVEAPGATQQAPVNQPWTSGPDTRIWRNTPDSTDTQYTIELLPASGSLCNPADPAGSMINPSNGTFRIRATGRSAAKRGGGWTYRSVVGTFRRRGFLDFLYFTDYETSPPTIYAAAAQGWAASHCNRYVRDGRLTQTDPATGTTCTNIQFAPTDVVNGPMHTNDNILICGNPTFGRTVNGSGQAVSDNVEVSDPTSPGYRTACAGSPNVRPAGNALKFNQPLLTLPPSNGSLSSIVKPEYLFSGTTTIRLHGNQMDVVDYGGPSEAQRTQNNLDIPSNGVVYVKDGTCGAGAFNAADPYNLPTGCGTAYVSGTYTKSLTIATERDIVVRPLPADPDNSGVLRGSGSDAMLGLIANNLVRVFHNPQTDADAACEENLTNGSKRNIRIDAAILALNYSFTVDNFGCGDPLGQLTVNGVIAQKFRGPVGTGGASGTATGYSKNYSYDDRLQYRSPPYFLDPVQSAWQTVRYNEQTPAQK
jgi:Tfp pilus assembly protein PilX